MRRIGATLAVATLVLGACGGDDDAAGDDLPSPAAGEAAADDETPEPASESATDDGSNDDGSDDDGSNDDGSNDDGSNDDGSDDDSGSTRSINSINDVPERCRELMAEFLRNIEPIVSTVDWETATFADFQDIAAEFDQFQDPFDVASDIDDECADLDIDDETNLDLLTEFAGDVAPGTVEFMKFIATMATSFDPAVDDGDAPMGDTPTITDCEGAIEVVKDLIERYDTIADVPVSEMAALGQLGTAMPTCTPEQLEFFSSPEATEFLGGI